MSDMMPFLAFLRVFWEREISSLFQKVDGFAGIGISDLVVESVLLNRKLILYNENKKGL